MLAASGTDVQVSIDSKVDISQRGEVSARPSCRQTIPGALSGHPNDAPPRERCKLAAQRDGKRPAHGPSPRETSLKA
jgi:hypothetical protein